MEEFLQIRVEALEKENARLNDEIRKVKEIAYQITLTHPTFYDEIKNIDVR